MTSKASLAIMALRLSGYSEEEAIQELLDEVARERDEALTVLQKMLLWVNSAVQQLEHDSPDAWWMGENVSAEARRTIKRLL